MAFEDVEVLHGDTQVAPKGMDTYGSRSLVVGGEALVKAADKVIEKAKPIAAHLLEASVDDIEFNAGRFGVKGHRPGAGDRRRSRSRPSRRTTCPTAWSPHSTRTRRTTRSNFSFPHGTHLCAVEVDTETGEVKMRKYACVDDIGNIVNPLIVAGQVHGGLVQGIAQALFEEAVYDDSGTLVSGVLRGLPGADGRRHDQLRHRPHHVAVDDQHARHQGRRRGRHHRLDAGGGERRASTRCDPSASTTSRCRARPSGCGRRSTRRAVARTTHRRVAAGAPHFDEADNADRTEGSSL